VVTSLQRRHPLQKINGQPKKEGIVQDMLTLVNVATCLTEHTYCLTVDNAGFSATTCLLEYPMLGARVFGVKKWFELNGARVDWAKIKLPTAWRFRRLIGHLQRKSSNCCSTMRAIRVQKVQKKMSQRRSLRQCTMETANTCGQERGRNDPKTT
jgi:hypothetical protein